MPATLAHHFRSNCLHVRTTAPLLAACNPHTCYGPAHNRPQHATSSMHSRRSQASAQSAAARRCMQRTTELQRRQLRHPSETRCQRRCPSCSDPIVCTHRRPSARPSQAPNTRYSPARNRPRPQHSASPMHSRQSQAPAHSAAGRRCTQRTSKVQRRQLRHPSETRCQRRCPIVLDLIACTH